MPYRVRDLTRTLYLLKYGRRTMFSVTAGFDIKKPWSFYGRCHISTCYINMIFESFIIVLKVKTSVDKKIVAAIGSNDKNFAISCLLLIKNISQKTVITIITVFCIAKTIRNQSVGNSF